MKQDPDAGTRFRELLMGMGAAWRGCAFCSPISPRDEYDWLVRGVERELDDGAGARSLGVYMTHAVRSRYGLDDSPPPDTVAQRLVAL
jgi:hypothetical protein